MKAMKAEGRTVEDGETSHLHFIGNAKRGETGVMDVSFKDGRVAIIHAFIDQPGSPLEFIWNAELGGCSDFPGSNEKCNK
jgi:hypothetical protein